MTIQTATQFGVSNTPWSSGRSVRDVATMKEAMEIANLDFTVETAPVYQKVQPLTGSMIREAVDQVEGNTADDMKLMIESLMAKCYQAVNSHNVIRREDNNKVYGVCGNRWEPLQNTDAFDWFQPALDAGLVKLDTVGSLHGGRKIWILAELCSPPEEVVKGDPIAKYIILGNGHNGSTAIFVGFTPIRVWCANQFPRLARCENSSLIRLRHTKHAKVQLDNLRDIMDNANAEFSATVDQYRHLVNYTVNQTDLEKYVKVLFCNKAERETPLADLSARRRNMLESVLELVDTGIGLQDEKIKGTWYAAFNAVNQYLNYSAGRSVDGRLDSLWFGQNSTTNQKALDEALKLAV